VLVGASTSGAILGDGVFDVLTIDQSFVSRMDEDESSATIVSAIIAMIHALGLTLVAEGVERPSQAALLRAQGCDAAQGFLFGHPFGPARSTRSPALPRRSTPPSDGRTASEGPRDSCGARVAR